MIKVERQQQRFEELSGASIRALTGQKDLRFRGRRLHHGLKPVLIRSPHLLTDPLVDDFFSYRGAADGISMRLSYSDSEIYAQYQPEESVQQFIYELLEQIRVESIVSPRFPGIKRNLIKRFESWCLTYHLARLTETHVGLLLYTLYQVVWA